MSDEDTLVCGIVMPISEIAGCSEQHWQDVLQIHGDAVEAVGFSPNLVSNADEVGVIHNRIIQNLYTNPIVVCDVSARNPNVMFELGMRLAFDKPTIIVKDRETPFTFDTSSVEHLEYPRDLRFRSIVEFKEELGEKVEKTHKAASTDDGYTTFLGHFGQFHVAQIDAKAVPTDEFIVDELVALRREMRSLLGPKRQIRGPRLSERGSMEGLRIITEAIKDFQRQVGTRSKKVMREKRDAAYSFVEMRVPGPRYFHSPEEFDEAFDTAFSLLYE